MAKAETVAAARPDIQLTLSDREALALRQVCNQIGGDMEGPRGAIAAIGYALEKVGATSARARKVAIPENELASIYLRAWGEEA